MIKSFLLFCRRSCSCGNHHHHHHSLVRSSPPSTHSGIVHHPDRNGWRRLLNTTTTSTTTTTTQNSNNNNNTRKNHTSFVSSFIRWYSWRLDTHPYLIKGITSGLIAATGDFSCQYFLSSSLLSLQSSTDAIVIRRLETDDDDEHSSESTGVTRSAHAPANMTTNVEDPLSTSSSMALFSWWDSLRTLRFGVLGAFYVAPGCHVWYQQLAQWFPVVSGSAAALTPVVQRVILDQFAFTPVFLVGWLLSLTKLESFMTSPRTTTTTTSFESTSSSTDHRNMDPPPVSTTVNNLYHTIVIEQQLVQLLYSNWMLWIPVQICNFYYIPTKYQVLTSNCVALVWNMYLSFMTSSSSSRHLARPELE